MSFLFLDIFEVKVTIYLSHFSFHGAIRRAFTGKKQKIQFFFSTHYLFTSQLLLFCLKDLKSILFEKERHHIFCCASCMMKMVSINTISSGVLLLSKLSKPSKPSKPLVYFLAVLVIKSKPQFFQKNFKTKK